MLRSTSGIDPGSCAPRQPAQRLGPRPFTLAATETRALLTGAHVNEIQTAQPQPRCSQPSGTLLRERVCEPALRQPAVTSPRPLDLRRTPRSTKRNVCEDTAKYAWALVARCLQTRRRRHPRKRSLTEFASRRSCKTSNLHSWCSLKGRIAVPPEHQRPDALTVAKLLP
jgi:hypothetical protein